jgi:transcriptional regulator with XRE-family HTH domain
MSGSSRSPGGTFAERLDWLFRNTTDAGGKTYSVRYVANELTRRGCKISHTHLNNLRQGRAPDPRRSVIDAIAAFFGRPSAFLVETPGDPHEHELTQVLADPYIKRVAMRLVDAQLSPDGHAAVVAMIEQVRQLEAAAARRRDASYQRRGVDE